MNHQIHYFCLIDEKYDQKTYCIDVLPAVSSGNFPNL